MRLGLRRSVTLLAIYAVALHTVLLGIAPLLAASTADPFSVICHAEALATSPVDQTPVSPASAPTPACEYCNLCNAIAPPDTLDSLVIDQLTLTNLLEVLRPATAAIRDGIGDNALRVRGPPLFA